MDSIKEKVERAQQAEEAENNDLAIKEYEEILKVDPLHEYAYTRLMILFRKNKNSKREMEIINSGIKEYEKFYKSRGGKSRKISEISNKLNKAIGLIDRKGQNVYDPEPIATWKKRKAVLEKKKK
jgi:hypothetical protein